MYKVEYWDTQFVGIFHKELADYLEKHPNYEIKQILNDKSGYMIIFEDAVDLVEALFGVSTKK